jgi:hypothetical protein
LTIGLYQGTTLLVPHGIENMSGLLAPEVISNSEECLFQHRARRDFGCSIRSLAKKNWPRER